MLTSFIVYISGSGLYFDYLVVGLDGWQLFDWVDVNEMRLVTRSRTCWEAPVFLLGTKDSAKLEKEGGKVETMGKEISRKSKKKRRNC